MICLFLHFHVSIILQQSTSAFMTLAEVKKLRGPIVVSKMIKCQIIALQDIVDYGAGVGHRRRKFTAADATDSIIGYQRQDKGKPWEKMDCLLFTNAKWTEGTLLIHNAVEVRK